MSSPDIIFIFLSSAVKQMQALSMHVLRALFILAAPTRSGWQQQQQLYSKCTINMIPLRPALNGKQMQSRDYTHQCLPPSLFHSCPWCRWNRTGACCDSAAWNENLIANRWQPEISPARFVHIVGEFLDKIVGFFFLHLEREECTGNGSNSGD